MSELYRFLCEYRDSSPVRGHVPGHKGTALLPELAACSPLDITEIAGADSLFEADGLLLASERRTAQLFGSEETLYSVSGSTLCIQTMLACALKPGECVIAGRNAHVSFFNCCILLDLHPVWVLPQYPKGSNIAGVITPESVEEAFAAHPEAKAVYLTAPDYLGCLSDIQAIAAIAHAHGARCLVDNAHGAYLHFLKTPLHPMDLGADLCADSAHKTLPALTGAAYLHLAKGCGISRDTAKQRMHLFGSTSPSYLILLSLDACADYLESCGRSEIGRMAENVMALQQKLQKKGGLLETARREPGKLTFDCCALGVTGAELAEQLRRFTPMIEPEYVSESEVVLMFSPMTGARDYAAVAAFIDGLIPKLPIPREDAAFSLPEMVMYPRETFYARQELVRVEDALGRIAAENRVTCPPGVPVVTAGEQINKESINFLQKAGISFLNVI